MGIRLVVAVTDSDWFDFLKNRPDLTEVNFWAPGGASFRALQPGELFLFKLHSPRNFIAGYGVFAYANEMPCSLAWETFAEANGAVSFIEMRRRILRYRKIVADTREDFSVGCRILTQAVFFEESDWIPVPASWKRNTQVFKTYDTDDADGTMLWEAVRERSAYSARPFELSESPTSSAARYGRPVLIEPRLGQGAFRIIVTDNYHRKCAVTRERTLPALDAAHVKPYAEGGEHAPQNGLLLRKDIHSLFDAGYVTITPSYRFEVSRRIKEEFENGHEYYALNGREIGLPDDPAARPNPSYLTWHNEVLYRG